jgi:DNA-binding MarR family transcriptional regulator
MRHADAAGRGTGEQHLSERHVMTGLVKALDWFDNGLQSALEARGYRRVHRTQSMILVHIARGIVHPADIAREMGSTRQNVHHMAKALIDAGLVVQERDPDDPRRSIYTFARSAARIRGAALEIIEGLEATLAARIGADALEKLRTVLQLDWGPALEHEPPRRRAAGDAPQGRH